jgi:uncharacterized RDD family membrane protein YckC
MARVVGLLVYVLIAAAGIILAYAFRDNSIVAGAAIGGSLVVAAFGFIWAAFDRHRRTLHDRIAGTIVVRLV